MDFKIDDIVSVLMLLGGWVGIYAGFKVKIAVLEREVNDLRLLVSELRQDIKLLLSRQSGK